VNAVSEYIIALLSTVLLSTPSLSQQSSQEHKTTHHAAQKTVPTLGFNHIKDVSPILDEDAYFEESKLEKQLPGNQFVYDKRAVHEGILMNNFLTGFKDSKECNGITF
jgi:hypothetical protein